MKKQRKPRPGKTKKPGAAVAAHSPRAVPRLVKRTVLLWVGYMLAALAVFGGMKDFFELADLVRTLTWKWDNWNHLLWATVFGYDPDKFPPGFAIRLTFLAALLIISISAQIADEREQEDKSKFPENYWVEVLRDIENFKFGQAFSIVYLSIFTFNFAIDKLIFKSDSIIFLEERPVLMAVALGISLAVLVAILFYRGISEFGHTLLLIAFMSSFYFALTYTGANSAVASGRDMVAVYREVLLKGNFFVGYIHMTAILQIAPPKYFNMRFYNIIIFVMLITLLNYAIILKERLS